MMHRPIVLASGSPRRIEMLTTCGLQPQVVPSSYDEALPCPLAPAEQAMFFALGKALDVRSKLTSQAPLPQETFPEQSEDSSFMKTLPPVLVGADTIVVLDGQVLGKPHNRAHAKTMLQGLSGRTHQVITGVCLADGAAAPFPYESFRLSLEETSKAPFRYPEVHCFYDVAYVTVKPLSEEEIEAYLDTDEPYDKAGSYGIQGVFRQHIAEVTGDINTVIGFPLEAFLQQLADFEKR